MSARRLRALAIVALATAATLSACQRPTGDFGRARPSALHDDLMPRLGGWIAEEDRGEPVSRFALSDAERELRDRSFAFVRAPQDGDWWQDTLVEGQRTRILPALDAGFDPARYYAFLIAEPHLSSEARWERAIADIQADAMLVPPFCEAAARVRRADVERLAALGRPRLVDEAFAVEAYERVHENNEVMAWVWRALAYRLTAYRIAIDRLEIETPSDRLWTANRAFDALAAARCRDAPALAAVSLQVVRPGRTFRGPDPFDAPVLQK